MNWRKITKLREEINSLRAKGGLKATDLESMARRLGRQKASRGKEPNWINPGHLHLRPISIPHHGRGLKKGTVKNILDAMERDLDAFELLLDDDEDRDNEEDENDDDREH